MKGKSSKETINVFFLNVFELSQSNTDIDQRVFRKARSNKKNSSN